MNEVRDGWLESLRADLISISEGAARQLWPGARPEGPAFFNYRLEHVRQVEREARYLLASAGGDEEVVLASVWLHDRWQPAFQGADHGPHAAAWAAEHLAARGFPEDKVERVCFAVTHHSDPPGTLPPEAHEARLLWDADKLAHTGAAEVLLLLLASTAADRVRDIPNDPAFPEGRLTLADWIRMAVGGLWQEESPAQRFYLEPARQRAAERWAAQQAFLASLREQASPESG